MIMIAALTVSVSVLPGESLEIASNLKCSGAHSRSRRLICAGDGCKALFSGDMRAAPSFRAEPTTPGTLPPVPSSRGSSSQSVSRGGSRGSGRRTVGKSPASLHHLRLFYYNCLCAPAGPGGFGRQYDVFEGASSAPLQQEQEWGEEAAEYYQGVLSAAAISRLAFS